MLINPIFYIEYSSFEDIFLKVIWIQELVLVLWNLLVVVGYRRALAIALADTIEQEKQGLRLNHLPNFGYERGM